MKQFNLVGLTSLTHFEHAYVNSLAYEGVDKWFKVTIITEGSVFASSRIVLFDDNGIEIDDNHPYLDFSRHVGEMWSRMPMYSEPDKKSEKVRIFKNREFEEAENQQQQDFINKTAQDWGVSGITFK